MNYTSIEQSKKLLELGLSPESADMTYSKGNSLDGYHLTTMPFKICYGDFIAENGNMPCWSVDKLLQLMPRSIRIVNTFYGYELYVSVIGFAIDWWDVDRRRKLFSCDEETLIDVCYKTVVWLLENGYIQKED